MRKKLIALILCIYFVFSSMPINGFCETKYNNENSVFELSGAGTLIEAEDLTYDDTWEVIKDDKASSGKAISSNSNGIGFKHTVYTIKEAPLKINIDAKESGSYFVYFRIKKTGRTTYYYRFNETGFYTFSLVPTNLMESEDEDYIWVLLTGYKFKQGRNIIEIMYRNDMVLDKFLITKNAVDAPENMGEIPHEFNFEDAKEGKYFYPMPPVVPKEGHPRLLIDNSDIEKIKKNLNHERNIKVYNKVKEISEKNYDCLLNPDNITGNSNPIYLDYIKANAFLYVLDKDVSKGKKAIEGIYNYLRTFAATPSSNAASREGTYMVYVASLVYDWCNDIIPKEKREEIVNLCISHLGRTELKWPPALSYDLGHNEETMLPYMLAFGIAVYDDYPYAYNVVAGNVFNEGIRTRKARYEDESYILQGDYYAGIRGMADCLLKIFLKDLGCENMIPEGQRYNGYQYIYRSTPVGNYLMDGDCESYSLVGHTAVNPLADYMGGYLYNDPYLLNEFYRFYNDGEFKLGNFTDVEYLIFSNPNLPLKQREELPLTFYAGDKSGMLTARTGWDEGINSDDMIVSMKMPERFTGGHQHRDAGHFYIYYKGPLALDSGIYGGKSFIREDGTIEENVDSESEHNLNYNRQTIAHNAMLIYDPDEEMKGKFINTGGQHVLNPDYNTEELYEKTSKYGEVLGVDYGEDMNSPSYSYIKGDLTDWYNGKAENYTRTFMFFNFFDDTYPGALIVLDNVTSKKKEFQKYYLLHSQEKPEIDGNKAIIKNTKWGYDGKLINETILPKKDNLKIDVVGKEGEEFIDLQGVNHKAVPRKEYGDESGNYRVEVKPENKEKQDYFLNVIQVSENSLNLPPLEVESFETDNHFGIKIKDRIALLNKENKRSSKDVFFEVKEGEENYIITVDGLKEGNYIIYKDGKKLCEKKASEQGGVISFKGTKGKYRITKDKYHNVKYKKDFNILHSVVPKENKIYVKLNNIFNDDLRPLKVNNNLYLPLEKLIKYIDDKATVNTVKKDVEIDIFKDTKFERKILLKSGESKGKYIIDNKENTWDFKIPLTEKEGIIYVPLTAIKKDVFLTEYYFENISDVLTIKTNFKRKEDNIIKHIDDGRFKIKSVEAPASDEGVFPEYTLDNDITTKYYIYGTNQYITYELENTETISDIGIIWSQRTSRQAKFEITLSEDGVNYVSVFKGMSDIINEKDLKDKQTFEMFKIKPTKAKYIKLKLYGSTTKDISTICEFAVY